MANVTTNFNVSPYYDDYDEDKAFLRVLFRPGYAVQARELTQLQTILQKQSSRLGDHIFKDGSSVLGGEVTLDTEVSYLKLSSSDTAATFADGVISDTSVTAGAGTTRAQVIAAINAVGSDAPTLIIKFISGTAFSTGSTIYLEGSVATTATVAATSASGNASVVSINRGVYFVGGFFVLCLPQTLVLEKYNNTPTYRIGLTTTESIVDSTSETSLLDPSSGTTNANAPGATRFKITLTLAKKETTSGDPVAANADSNFIELMRVSNGTPTKHTKYPVYGEIEKMMARRTYDESGDYTIKPFPIEIVNHKGATGTTSASSDTTITGVLTDFENDFEVGDSIYLSSATTTYATISSITNSTSMVVGSALGNGTSQTIYNRNRVSAALDPGKAYVKGFEYESIGTEYVDVKKGRGITTETNFPINPNFGNSLKVTNFNAGNANTNSNAWTFDPEDLSRTYDLHNVKLADIDGTGQNAYNATKMGTTRIRQIDYSSGEFTNASTSNTAILDMYIFDTQLSALTCNVGVPYTSGETAISFEAAKSSTANNAYTGAKVKLGSETREITDFNTNLSIALESGVGTGSLVLDSTDGVADAEDNIITEFAGATINLAFSTSADISNTVTINYSTRELESIAAVNSSASYAVANTVRMDIDDSGKSDTNDSTSNTVIQDTDLNSLVFPIGFDNVKGIGTQSGTSFTAQGVTFQRKEVLDITFSDFSSATGATIQAPTGTTFETEGLGSGNLVAPKANYILVAANNSVGLNGGQTISAGQIVDCTVTVVDNENVTITPKLDGSAFSSGSLKGKVYATCDIAGKGPKTVAKVTHKAVTSGADIVVNNKSLNTDCTNAEQNNRLSNGHFICPPITGTQSLGTADVIEVTNVIEASAANNNTQATQFGTLGVAVGNTAHVNNITSRFSFNNGQKDNFYDHASITLKPGQTPPANNIFITFNYFSHTPSDGYVSVTGFLNGSVDFEDIPAFISPTTGERKERRDHIDFRPVKGFANGATNAGIIQSNDSMPDAKIKMSANVAYYLPRKDKLTLTKDRVFKVLEGISSENPALPADDEDAMTLYNLDIPAYTHNASDVDTQYIDNRRFTMRDIGKIEKRVDQIEYYTALSLLEKEANDLSIKDSATNTERFKNGILVDSFNGHNIGDVSNEDFKAAVDMEMKELRPTFSSDAFKFTHDSSGSSANTAKTGDLITLAYSGVNAVCQPLASNTETINPYATTQLNGQLSLSPPSDVWFADSERPIVLINLENLNDHWVEGNDYGFGKQWDDWSFTWSGVQVNDDNLLKNRKTSATSNTVSRSVNVISKNKTRTGIVSTKPPETIKRSVGNRTVSISTIPYMRSQRVQFLAKGIKPNARFYPYFDNTDVSANTKSAYILTYSANASSSNSGVFNTKAGEQVTLTQTSTSVGANTANTTGIALYQNSTSILVSDIIQEVTLSGAFSANPTIGDSVIFYSDAGKTSETARGTIQAYDATKFTLTVNSISGTIATTNYTGNTASGGNFGSATISHTGGFATGEIFQGTGSAKANGNITGVGSTGPTYSGSLTADRHGVLGGELTIPANTFRTGEKLFRLTDSSTDTVASTESVAEKIFRAQGMLESRSGRMSSTRPMETKRENVKDSKATQDTINRITTSTNWVNPLSQTFIVDRNENPNGIFASSIDIFFAAVDSTLPVTLQLRPVVNEFPSSSAIIPFSEVTLNASDVTANAATPNVAVSTTATKFTFDSPVYLYPDEYAIVLTSPSTAYTVHVANLGETVKNTTSTKVSQQPNVGIFYQPQNSSVWQPNVEKQMMFKINRCNFDTGSHSVYLSSGSESLSGNTSTINYDVFKLSTSELTFSNTSIGFSYKGIDESKTVNSDSTRTSQIDSSFTSFSANRNITLAAQKKVVAPISTTGPVTYSANNYYLRAVLTSNDSKISPAIDTSRINLITVENLINRGSFANSDVVISAAGTGYSAGTFDISGTGGSGGVVTTTVSGTGAITSAYISSAGSGYYEDAAITLSGGTAGSITISTELGATGGNAKSKYISRRVTLEDTFDAQDLKVFLNAYKPKDTDIKVYYKVHNAEDPEDFEDKPYTMFTQETDANLISANESDIKSYVFRTSANNISYTSNSITYDKFKTFAIKIVLGSASTAIIPKVKDMKAIALDF